MLTRNLTNLIILLSFFISVNLCYGNDTTNIIRNDSNVMNYTYGPFEDEICELCLEDGDYNILEFLGKDSNSISWGLSYSIGTDFGIGSENRGDEIHESKYLYSFNLFICVYKFIYLSYSTNILTFTSRRILYNGDTDIYTIDRKYSHYGIRLTPYENNQLQTYIGYGIGSSNEYNTYISEFQIGMLYNLHRFRDKVNLGMSISGNYGQFFGTYSGYNYGIHSKTDLSLSLGMFLKF
jgi:hypothetical protein